MNWIEAFIDALVDQYRSKDLGIQSDYALAGDKDCDG